MDAKKIICPHCGNPECEVEDTYCFNCGNPLFNYCTDVTCPFSDLDSGGLRPSDVFCPTCGAPSTFYKGGFIQPRSFEDEE